MRRFRDASLCAAAAAVLLAIAPGAAQQEKTDDLLSRAEDAVALYIAKLADVHCTEEVHQVKVRPDGKPEATVKTEYDYFVLLQGNSIDLQLAESRLAAGKEPQRQTPLLLSNGLSMLLLMFHPYYRAGFTFHPEGPEEMAGRHTMRYHFAHIAGTRTPSALALRQREYPLDLQGTAWIDAESGQPIRIDAGLLQPMTDVGLKSLTVHVEYVPVAAIPGNPVLVSVADVDLETPRQHWRNSHTFRNYKLFSAEATQDPNVKVHTTSGGAQNGSAPPQTEEKP